MNHLTVDTFLLGVFLLNGFLIAYAAESIWMVLFSAACTSFVILSLVFLAHG
jgi:hypothetical protein